jgi:hypothetical protein
MADALRLRAASAEVRCPARQAGWAMQIRHARKRHGLALAGMASLQASIHAEFGAGGGCAGFARRASHFSCFAKKSNQKKATRVRRLIARSASNQLPCAARPVGRLRNSPRCARLRQCSPTSPDSSALLGGSHGRSRCASRREKIFAPYSHALPEKISETASSSKGRRICFTWDLENGCDTFSLGSMMTMRRSGRGADSKRPLMYSSRKANPTKTAIDDSFHDRFR